MLGGGEVDGDGLVGLAEVIFDALRGLWPVQIACTLMT